MPEMITERDAQYALDLVKEICTQVGPGLPGSPQERERAGIVQRELEAHLGPGNTEVEEFTLAPGAFLGVYPTSALLTLTAVALNMAAGRLAGASVWISAGAALALAIVAPLLLFFEYVRYEELVDRFFRQKRSINVIGTLRRPGTKNVKRLLILSGHHDSAPENTWIRFLGYGFYITVPTIFVALAAMLVMSII